MAQATRGKYLKLLLISGEFGFGSRSRGEHLKFSRSRCGCRVQSGTCGGPPVGLGVSRHESGREEVLTYEVNYFIGRWQHEEAKRRKFGFFSFSSGETKLDILTTIRWCNIYVMYFECCM